LFLNIVRLTLEFTWSDVFWSDVFTGFPSVGGCESRRLQAAVTVGMKQTKGISYKKSLQSKTNVMVWR
jgi:hypothetical protein